MKRGAIVLRGAIAGGLLSSCQAPFESGAPDPAPEHRREVSPPSPIADEVTPDEVAQGDAHGPSKDGSESREPSAYPEVPVPTSDGPHFRAPRFATTDKPPMGEGAPPLTEVAFDATLARPPALDDRELELHIQCENAADDPKERGITWGALVQFESGEAKAVDVARLGRRRRYAWCQVTAIHRKRCSVGDMRRNDCDETDAVDLPSLCFVPDGETWTHRAPEACTDWFRRR